MMGAIYLAALLVSLGCMLLLDWRFRLFFWRDAVAAAVVTAVGLAITIIGIPFAWANLKMIPAALFPLGKQIVDEDSLRAGAYYRV